MRSHTTRRELLHFGRDAALVLGLANLGLFGISTAEGATFEVTHSDAEWRALLTGSQYDVLRQEGTERPFNSDLNHEKREGMFSCAGCSLPLFSSKTKFDSGTGWPSFWKPLDNAVAERRIRRSSWSGLRFTAAVAEGIWGMFSTTGLLQPACATA